MLKFLNLYENYDNLCVWSDVLTDKTLLLISIFWVILILSLAFSAWKTRRKPNTFWLIFTFIAAFIHFLVLFPGAWNYAFEHTNSDIIICITFLGMPFLVFFYPLLTLIYGIEQSSMNMNILALIINGLATLGLAIYFVFNFSPDISHCSIVPAVPPAYAHIITIVITILLLATTLICLVTGIILKNYADINMAIVLLIGNLYAIAIWATYLHDWANYTDFYMQC